MYIHILDAVQYYTLKFGAMLLDSNSSCPSGTHKHTPVDQDNLRGLNLLNTCDN